MSLACIALASRLAPTLSLSRLTQGSHSLSLRVALGSAFPATFASPLSRSLPFSWSSSGRRRGPHGFLMMHYRGSSSQCCCWLTPLCPLGVSRGPGSIFGILVIGGASRVSYGIGRAPGSTSRISDLGQRLGKFNMFTFGTFPITDCALSSVRTSSSVIFEPRPTQLPLHHISSAYPARKLAGCAFAINALGGSEAFHSMPLGLLHPPRSARRRRV